MCLKMYLGTLAFSLVRKKCRNTLWSREGLSPPLPFGRRFSFWIFRSILVLIFNSLYFPLVELLNMVLLTMLIQGLFLLLRPYTNLPFRSSPDHPSNCVYWDDYRNSHYAWPDLLASEGFLSHCFASFAFKTRINQNFLIHFQLRCLQVVDLCSNPEMSNQSQVGWTIKHSTIIHQVLCLIDAS